MVNKNATLKTKANEEDLMSKDNKDNGTIMDMPVAMVKEGPSSDESYDAWQQAPARIKVIGVGGGGCNCVRRMVSRQMPGVKYVMVNTDIKALERQNGKYQTIWIGPKVTRGWGAGGSAKVGESAAEESSQELHDAVRKAELVLLTSGMGGGTGTGAAPVVAKLAKEQGALVVAIVTMPFSFEGKLRLDQAVAGLGRLRNNVDNLIIIHNDRLLQYVDHDAGVMDAFKTADEVVTQGIFSISELINVPGEINVDFADVHTIMNHRGGALMAIGQGTGSEGPVEAAKQAIANPLLNVSIKGAKGVLFSVKGGNELTLGGVNAAGKLIGSHVDKDASIFFGLSIDPALEDKVKLTLIATGLKSEFKL